MSKDSVLEVILLSEAVKSPLSKPFEAYLTPLLTSQPQSEFYQSNLDILGNQQLGLVDKAKALIGKDYEVIFIEKDGNPIGSWAYQLKQTTQGKQYDVFSLFVVQNERGNDLYKQLFLQKMIEVGKAQNVYRAKVGEMQEELTPVNKLVLGVLRKLGESGDFRGVKFDKNFIMWG